MAILEKNDLNLAQGQSNNLEGLYLPQGNFQKKGNYQFGIPPALKRELDHSNHFQIGLKIFSKTSKIIVT